MASTGGVPRDDNNACRKPYFVAREYRNRRIGDFLKELDLTEDRGTGIPKIRRTLSTNGSPAPLFETDVDRTYFLATVFIHPEVSRAAADLADLGPSQEGRIVEALQKHELSASEIARAVGAKTVTGALKRKLRALLEQGLIERTIQDKPMSRLQKYRLTEDGMNRPQDT